MKRLLALTLLGLAMPLLASRLPAAPESAEPWPFFPFDNGVGRGTWPAAKQAATVKSLGYQGIHYNFTTVADFSQKLAACKEAGVPIYGMYVYTFVSKPDAPYDAGIKEAIRMLKGTSTTIWMTLREGKKGQQDDVAAGIVRDIATQAADAGLKVSIYPHAGFYVSNAEEAVRVAKVVNMPNVGVTVNLCHELFAGNSERLGEVVKTAIPYLNMVSINGASHVEGKDNRVWDTLPLGTGTFDTKGFLELLWKAGYRGPIGHQFYAVKGDDMQKLTTAVQAWEKMKSEIVPPPTTATSH